MNYLDYLNYLIYLPLIIWLLLSLSWLFLVKKETRNRYIDSIPSGFTTTGVLGTFLGIFIGLQGFDVNTIQDSIPLLLEGLKGAFLTSIVGIICSLIFQKIIEFRYYTDHNYYSDETLELIQIKALLSKPSAQNNTVETLERIYKEIKDTVGVELLKLNQSNSTLQKSSEQRYIEFKSLLSSFNLQQSQLTEKLETTITRQTFQINKNTTENNTTLINSLEESNQKVFEKLAEMNSKELLSAMEKSVEVFNKKMEDILSKLIKENFDALNNSVNQLNDWQEQHKSNVDNLVKTLGALIAKNNEMIKAMESTSSFVVTNLSKASKEMNKIADRTKELTNENGRLQKIIKELEKIFVEENQMTKLVDEAKVSVEKMNAATGNFNDGMDKVAEIQNQIFHTSQSITLVHSELKQIAEFKDINGAYWDDVKLKLDAGVSILNNASKSLGENLEDIDETFKANLDETFSNLDKLITHYIVRNELEI